MKCGIKHGFGDQTCIRKTGHDGHSHWSYHTIYPKNATKPAEKV